MAERKPVRLHWELETSADRQTTWDFFSDTDRFNRAAGLRYRYTDEKQSDGTLRRTGQVTRLGMTLTWDEKPFHYATPDWFRSVREFQSGPASQLVTTARFKDNGKGGTGVHYTVEVTPRNFFCWPIVALEMNGGTRKTLDRIFSVAIQTLDGQEVVYDPPVTPLSTGAMERLSDLCAKPDDPEVGRKLLRLISEGALRDQDRIRPLALARNWCLSGESVTHACLVAARAGVLTVRWEVLCPSCRGPQESLPKLSFRGMRIHCYSCNLKFDGTLADALEVTFRPAPDIRTINLQVACAGSPGRQPHVLAQGVLPPDGQLEWMMTLEPGQYRLATIPMDNAGAGSDGRLNANPVLVDVAEDASERRGTIQLASTGMQPQRLHLRPGPIRLVVDSEVPAAMALKLETRWQGEDVLTAGNLLENPKARGLIPGDTLDPAFTAEVLQKGVLVAESFHDHQGTLDALESALQASGSNHLHRGERKLVASFSEPSALLQAALAIVRNADAQIALGWGSVVEAQEDGQTAIWGTAVQHAQSVLPAARPGTMVVSEGPAQQAELGRAALELGLSIKQQEGRLPGGRPVYVFSAESKP